MRLLPVSAAALLILGVAAPAMAGQTPGAAPQLQPRTEATVSTPAVTRTAISPRAVMICDTDAATRAAYTRDFGAPPVFISARQAVDVRQTQQTWATPRCMTASEHARYVSLTRSIAAR